MAAEGCIRSVPDLSHTLQLLLAHHGEIVLESYYHGCGPTDIRPIHSVTKSITSTLVGILVTDGRLSLEGSVASLLPAPAFSADPAKRAITVGHLLAMSSGLDGKGHWDIDALADCGGPVMESVLAAPLLSAPGQTFSYSNGAAHVLSGVIEAVAGKPTAAFAADRLFTPLRIDRWSWARDPQGCH